MMLSDLSIKKPVFAWMLMAALLIFGGIGFLRMGISQTPDVDFPVANISVAWKGAAPEIIESDVVDVIEESLMNIEGVKKINSSSRFGEANITIDFELSKNIDVAIQEIQTKITQARRRLPNDVETPIINKINPEDQPIVWIGVSGNIPYRELMEYVRDHLKDSFSKLPGVGDVFLGGYVEPNVRIWLNTDKLNQYQLTAEDVMAAVQSQHLELPAGRLTTETHEKNIRVFGEADSIKSLENITIPSRVRGGYLWKKITLKDVATIEDGLDDVRRLARVMGQPSVGLGIRKQRGTNAVDVAHEVKKQMLLLEKKLPQNLKLTLNYDGTEQIEENVREMEYTILLAVICTGLVCWLFLGSWTSTFNVILAIPTALCGAFLVMYFMGFTLNILTLLGLSMVVGIVVDDAIVVLENITRHQEMGKSRVLASIVGSREVTFAVIAISAAVIAIFLPVAFMKGLVGKFFFQFGIAVSAAVAFSLLEATTITPARCSQFLRVGHRTHIGQWVDWTMKTLSRLYLKTLAIALNHRWKILVLTLGLFFSSLLLIPDIRKEMTPHYDISRFMVRLQTPPGSSLTLTNNALKEAEKFIMQQKALKVYFVSIGGFGGADVNTAVMFITLKKPNERPINPKTGKHWTLREFMGICRKHFNKIPGVTRATIQELTGVAGAGARDFQVDLSILGPDWKTLGKLSHALMDKLKQSGLTVDLDTDFMEDIPEVHIIPDREKAALYGVTLDMIAKTVQATLSGVQIAKFTKSGRRYDIKISLADVNRQNIHDLSKIFIRNQRGELIRLKDVTKIIEEPEAFVINRENRQRAVRVFGNVAPGQSQSTAIETAQKIAREIFPEDYHLVLSGSSQIFQESFQELLLALWLGITIAYMILAAQFNSFCHPFTILLALPFSLSGALLGLWTLDHSLNILSMIGLLLLMGIVKKNSILLVDFTNQHREKGLDVKTALLTACPLRLRPILMTSLAIIAGAFPAMLYLGPGSEQRAPMATVIIWGTFVSTLLTLYVVPCVYSLMSRLESHKHQKEHEEAKLILDSQ